MNETDKKKVVLIFLIVVVISLAGFGLAWIIARQRDILYPLPTPIEKSPASYSTSYPESYASYPSQN